MSIQRQLHEIATQTKRPHCVDESCEDVINSQGLTFIMNPVNRTVVEIDLIHDGEFTIS